MLTLTTKNKTGKVLRRNGRIYRNRICFECEKKHYHAEKMCIKCRNTQQAKRRNKPYIKRKDTVYFSEKEQRICTHEKRISAEMTAIRNAGMCPISDSYQAILDAGVALDGFFDQLPRCLAYSESSQYANTTVVSEETNALHLMQNSSSRENKRAG